MACRLKRFIVDAQLPPALAKWVSVRKHKAGNVAEQQMQAVPDSVIWDYAPGHAAMIITKDEDFAQRKVLITGSWS